LVAFEFLFDDVSASLSGLTRFELNNDTNPTNQPINSSGDDRNVATARYESQEVILVESGPMAPVYVQNKRKTRGIRITFGFF